jgi:hypothetical protein
MTQGYVQPCAQAAVVQGPLMQNTPVCVQVWGYACSRCTYLCAVLLGYAAYTQGVVWS